ncbi:alpha/beta hydrolase family protein [Paenibacillus sp. GCM10027626]|uniref:alpha/beta hydrolase family protein n=1 Tax=Paenibacillus sp. GCM10027626 TaxID=3273411 RepID=UPI00363AB5F6
MSEHYERFEDRIRTGKQEAVARKSRYSPYCDFIYYRSSRDQELQLAMRVLKPRHPAKMLVTTHGWHMSIPPFEYMEEPFNKDYLVIEVDMRGRAYSDGEADCNGWELLDIIDAVNYVRKHYAACIIDPEIVYFEAGSGGGGNAYALAGKFPDFFTAVTALCGISNYALWYNDDDTGEFRDELDVWIGCSPETHPMAYESRSGLALAANLLTPLFICHGETDIRVPVAHARRYVQQSELLGKNELVTYLELPGVGTRDHWGNAAAEQMEQLGMRSERHRQKHSQTVEIPVRGSFIVAGYLYTKRFSVVLDSLDQIARIDYDLEYGEFKVTGHKQGGYTLNVY